MNASISDVDRAARELRMALEQHTYAMKYGTPEDTVHTADEVEAARRKLHEVQEREASNA